MLTESIELLGILRNRRLSPRQLRTLQEQRLIAVLEHAQANVPYYRDIFQKEKIDLRHFRTLEDLRDLPITTKADLRSAGSDAFITDGLRRSSLMEVRTTGSSGQPISIFHNRREGRIRRLMGFRAHHTAGYRPRDRLCVLKAHAGPVRLHHRLGFYRTHCVPMNLPVRDQLTGLVELQPRFLRAWPTTLRALMHHTDYRLHSHIQPEVVLTSSEVLSLSLRSAVRQDLGVEIFNIYVATEVGEIAYECPAHRGLHVNADQLILEILDEENRPCRPQQQGTAVITSLFAFSMPVIRFSLGDLCEQIDDPCSCGATLPLIADPLGRGDDLIRLPGGDMRSATGAAVLLDRYEGVHQMQLIQEEPHRFFLQLVLRQNCSRPELSEMKQCLTEYLGSSIDLDIREVSHIQKETVKSRWFVSRVPPPTG
jgi:phenylacetate-CoA ligase